ncbi:hypothetical protein I553_9210 [Mycobacterium xenopi 4042]|uniref:Uncharacterized protein n=1 Tax=Mycobacterium xenopi 4042 TaxID=1299334 RepID=X8AAH6_MYCXE|nr:hypothetical protein I553_9210 [Mycobacterium xenopi 4042]
MQLHSADRIGGTVGAFRAARPYLAEVNRFRYTLESSRWQSSELGVYAALGCAAQVLSDQELSWALADATRAARFTVPPT